MHVRRLLHRAKLPDAAIRRRLHIQQSPVYSLELSKQRIPVFTSSKSSFVQFPRYHLLQSTARICLAYTSKFRHDSREKVNFRFDKESADDEMKKMALK